LELLRDEPVQVLLFGSWAKGEADPTSDVDIGIRPKGPWNPKKIRILREKLEESTIPLVVEVVDLSMTSEDFQASVFAEGILWSKDTSARDPTGSKDLGRNPGASRKLGCQASSKNHPSSPYPPISSRDARS